MAGADYYSCDVCGAKTFYDANLNYEHNQVDGYYLEGVGQMMCICEKCSEKYEIVLMDKEQNETR